MSSGSNNISSGLDRILKLWISLWNLVLENKRHCESVCAVLQRLVFEKTAWPQFKNWPAICQLGKTEPLMQRIIQDLDLSQVTERSARIIAAFSDCFSCSKVSGIPLSVIIDHVARKRVEDPDNAPADYAEQLSHVKTGKALMFLGPQDNYLADFGFPLTFLYDQDVDLIDAEMDGPEDVPRFLCPEGISSKNTTGWTEIAFQGRLYVIVEVYEDCQCLTIVPAEYIALDL